MRIESPAEHAARRWRVFHRWQAFHRWQRLLAAVLTAVSWLLLSAVAASDTTAQAAASQATGPVEPPGSTSRPTEPAAAVVAPPAQSQPQESQPQESQPQESQPWVRHPQPVELPAAPEPFARWIELGAVAFDFYDPQREPFDFDAETRFRFHYSYRCQTRWRLVDAAEVAAGEQPTAATGESWLEVRPVYDKVTLTVSHRVRLPATLAGAGFYDHPLVQHEFDHIAISADPGLPARLRRMLEQRNQRIVEPLPPAMHASETVHAAEAVHTSEAAQHARRERLNLLADAAVRRESDRMFQQFMQAVAIRYRELDQVTSHGRRPLAAADRYRLIDFPAGK